LNLLSKVTLGTGHFMAALNIDHIMNIDFFKQRMDEYIEEIKNCPAVEGVSEI